MKTLLFAVLAALVLAVSASAARAAASGSITGPNEPGPYAFQDSVSFTTSTSGLKGKQYPMIYLACYSVVDGSLLTGQLDHADAVFVLGAGSSQWHLQRDDANCSATLFAYGGTGQTPYIVQLAAPVWFQAAG